jgi:hypothetical protein
MASRPRTYWLEVRGELGDLAGRSFPAMRIFHEHGNTVLVGPLRNSAELARLLERCSALGLTLLSVKRVNDGGGSVRVHLGEPRAPGGSGAARDLP